MPPENSTIIGQTPHRKQPTCWALPAATPTYAKLCYFVRKLVQAHRNTDQVADVDLALRQVLTTDTARYSELWESRTPNQRRVLEAVARSGGQEDIRSQRFREAHGLQSYRTVDYALKALVERSLIERVDPQHFSVPDIFLARWLRATPGSGP